MNPLLLSVLNDHRIEFSHTNHRLSSSRGVRARLAGKTEPGLCEQAVAGKGTNGTFGLNSSEQPRELCVRLASTHKGGIWCLSKRVGERQVYMVVEGCGTLNEVFEVTDRFISANSILSNSIVL